MASKSKRSSNPDLKPVASGLPLVVYLNCVEDCAQEQKELEGIASVEHVALTDIAKGKIEAASVVVVHSLAFLPRNAQRRLSPGQLILCLGSTDKQVDSTLAVELGLRLCHVDRPRADEIADSAMALILVLLRRTHDLATQRCGRISWAPGYTSLKGMKRLKGKVIGLIGTAWSAVTLAQRARGFKMKVIFLDLRQDDEFGHSQAALARLQQEGAEVARLEELLARSDVVSLHCLLTQETLKMLDEQAFRTIKKGALLINTSSSHLINDGALKRALIRGSVGGAALDGVEGPEWLEAWVREMPNVLITPRSCEYSDEVWAEVRVKASTAIERYLTKGVVPSDRLASDSEAEEVFTEAEGGLSTSRDSAATAEGAAAGDTSAHLGGRRRRSSRRSRGGRGQAQAAQANSHASTKDRRPAAWQPATPRPDQAEQPLESPALAPSYTPYSMDLAPPNNVVATEQQATALPQPETGQQPIQLGVIASVGKPRLSTFSSGDSLGEERRSSTEGDGPQPGSSGKRKNRRKRSSGKRSSGGGVATNLPTVHSGSDMHSADLASPPSHLPPGIQPPPFVTGPPFQHASNVNSKEWFSFQGGHSSTGNGPPSGEKEVNSAKHSRGKRKSGGPKEAAEGLVSGMGCLNLEGSAPPTSSYSDRTFVGARQESDLPMPPKGYDGKGILGEGPGKPASRRASSEMGGSLHGALEDGLMVAFKAKDKGQYWVAAEREGWALELAPWTVDSSDPAAQFLVVMRGKDRLGFRSLVADGKLLQVRQGAIQSPNGQATRKLELMFVNFSLDTLENWHVTGASLSDCVLSSKKFPEVTLAVSLEVLAVPPEDDEVQINDVFLPLQKPASKVEDEEESLV